MRAAASPCPGVCSCPGLEAADGLSLFALLVLGLWVSGGSEGIFPALLCPPSAHSPPTLVMLLHGPWGHARDVQNESSLFCPIVAASAHIPGKGVSCSCPVHHIPEPLSNTWWELLQPPFHSCLWFSSLLSSPFLHRPTPALPHTCTILHLQCPTPALSHSCTVHLHHPAAI